MLCQLSFQTCGVLQASKHVNPSLHAHAVGWCHGRSACRAAQGREQVRPVPPLPHAISPRIGGQQPLQASERIPSGDQDDHPVIGVNSKGGGLYVPSLRLPDGKDASIKGLGKALPLRKAALAANELWTRNGREPPNTPAVLQAMEEWLVRNPPPVSDRDDHPVIGVGRRGAGLYEPVLHYPGRIKASIKGLGSRLPLREAALAANELYERNGRPAPNTDQVMQDLEEWLTRHPNGMGELDDHPVIGVNRRAGGSYVPSLRLPDGREASIKGLGKGLPLRKAALAANELYRRNGREPPNTPERLQALEEWLVRHPNEEIQKQDNHPVIGVYRVSAGLYRPCMRLADGKQASVNGLGGLQQLREAALAANKLYRRNGREPPNTDQVMQELEEWLARHPEEDGDRDDHPVIGVSRKGGGLYVPVLGLPDGKKASTKGLGGAQPLRKAALAANELYARNGREPPNTPAVLQALEEWLARHPNEDVKQDNHPVIGVSRRSAGVYSPILTLPDGTMASIKGLGGRQPLRQAALAANKLYVRNGRELPNTLERLLAMEEWLARHPDEDGTLKPRLKPSLKPSPALRRQL